MTSRPGVERLEARDVPIASFRTLPVLPFENLAALDHARATFALGQELGRQGNVVLKIGDSNSSPYFTPNYLAPLGSPTYDPVASGLSTSYQDLLGTWWAFRSGPDSLAHEGSTAQPGWRTDSVLASLQGEVARTSPAIALVMIGTNDAMVFGDPAGFRDRLSLIIGQLLTAGVVPVLSTLPDSHFRGGKYESLLMDFNQVIADTGTRFAVPVWNTWRALHALPNQGLSPDGIHLDASPDGPASFWPGDLQYAQNVRNIQALRVLDWFRANVAANHAISFPARDWRPLESSRSLYSVGRDRGSSAVVEVHDRTTGEMLDRFRPFGPDDAGGVRVATGDVSGDGFSDIVCASRGIRGVVKVISGETGETLARFKPFDRVTSSGVTIALGDLDGDGTPEIVAARGDTGTIRIYKGRSFVLLSSFQSSPRRTKGVTIAVATIEGLGAVVVAASDRKHGTVRYLDPTGSLVSEFSPLSHPGQGASVAAADLDGDGFDEIVLVRPGARQRILVVDGATHAAIREWVLGSADGPPFDLHPGTLRSTSGADTLLIGSAPGSPVSVRAFNDLSGIPELLPPERSNRAFGIFVG